MAVGNPAWRLLHVVTAIPTRFTANVARNSYGVVRIQLVAPPMVTINLVWLRAVTTSTVPRLQWSIRTARSLCMMAAVRTGPLMLQAGLEEALRQEIRDFGELQLIIE